MTEKRLRELEQFGKKLGWGNAVAETCAEIRRLQRQVKRLKKPPAQTASMAAARVAMRKYLDLHEAQRKARPR